MPEQMRVVRTIEPRICPQCHHPVGGNLVEVEFRGVFLTAVEESGRIVFNEESACKHCLHHLSHHVGTYNLLKLIVMTGREVTIEELECKSK